MLWNPNSQSRQTALYSDWMKKWMSFVVESMKKTKHCIFIFPGHWNWLTFLERTTKAWRVNWFEWKEGKEEQCYNCTCNSFFLVTQDNAPNNNNKIRQEWKKRILTGSELEFESSMILSVSILIISPGCCSSSVSVSAAAVQPPLLCFLSTNRNPVFFVWFWNCFFFIFFFLD